MKNYQSFVSSFLIFTALFLSSVSAEAEAEDEREFDYLKDGEKGPQHWGDLKPEWSGCKHGKLQSPIDMTNDRVKQIKKSGELVKNYKPANAVLKNRGHDISLQWPKHDAGSIKIDGVEYILEQAHWHSPSEHTIDGKSYALELHMVHVSKDNKIAVVGLLYDLGKPDEFLSKLVSNITKMIEDDHVVESQMGMKDPKDIEMDSNEYYRYIGSLTVPPCTEGVIWTIHKKLGSVSKEQVHAMREAVHDYAEENARPVQPLHDREVHLYSSSNEL